MKITTTRPASSDEIAIEMDRRGAVIESLEADIIDLRAEVEILRKMQKAAGETSMLYKIRQELGWNEKTGLSLIPNGVRKLRMDSLRYKHLRDHCGSHYPMTQEQPAEWSISWEFQQSKPEERWLSFDRCIDLDIERLRAHEEEQQP